MPASRRWLALVLVVSISACAMEDRVRRRGAFAVCDATPTVDPFLSRAGRARRGDRFSQAIARGTAGTITTRPLAIDEVQALFGRMPKGLGDDLIVIEIQTSIEGASPARVAVRSRARGGAASPWVDPSIDEMFARFGTTAPSRADPEPRRTAFAGLVFLFSLGIVDVEGRWRGVFLSKPRVDEEHLARRDAALSALGHAVDVDPAAARTGYLLLTRTDAPAGPVPLRIAMLPEPGGCRYLSREIELDLTVPIDREAVRRFDGDDLRVTEHTWLW